MELFEEYPKFVPNCKIEIFKKKLLQKEKELSWSNSDTISTSRILAKHDYFNLKYNKFSLPPKKWNF